MAETEFCVRCNVDRALCDSCQPEFPGLWCKHCGPRYPLRIEWRDEDMLVAKPLTSFSLSGNNPKFSAIKETVQWPWAVCDNCKRESKGKK